MKLHCLGTTGFHPSPTRHTACYYLPEASLILDAGTGVFRMVEHLLREPKESLTILLSHAHLDHVVGLTFMIDALAVTDLKHIRVVGATEKIDAVKQHLYNELLFPVAPSFEFETLDGLAGRMPLNGFQLDWFAMEHPGGSLGFCLQNDSAKLAYVT
ncbi:MAG: MBL fold metallo-hydrolase, partial [Planctomycetota bacterium]